MREGYDRYSTPRSKDLHRNSLLVTAVQIKAVREGRLESFPIASDVGPSVVNIKTVDEVEELLHDLWDGKYPGIFLLPTDESEQNESS